MLCLIPTRKSESLCFHKGGNIEREKKQDRQIDKQGSKLIRCQMKKSEPLNDPPKVLKSSLICLLSPLTLVAQYQTRFFNIKKFVWHEDDEKCKNRKSRRNSHHVHVSHKLAITLIDLSKKFWALSTEEREKKDFRKTKTPN